MRVKGMKSILYAVAILATPIATLAAEPIVTSADPQSVVAGLTSAGFTPTLTKDNDGDPFINFSGPGGAYQLFFFGCKNHAGCTTLQYATQWQRTADIDPKAINDWHGKFQPLTAYIKPDGNVRVFAVLKLEPGGGLSQTLFAETLKSWTASTGVLIGTVSPAKQ